MIFHRDRGAEYLAHPLRAFLAAHGVRQSANTAGPGHNAQVESLFRSIKAEVIGGQHFATQAELRTVLGRYVRHRHTIRAHSALACRSPFDFERRVP